MSSICDRCGDVLDEDDGMDSDGLWVCDDCACLIADEEVSE